ncbi:unnamed protein product [Callosobruchus maculatus]|uniref:Beta-hexosaminidase n=2 Tax=Callosobruchus maculatus TaxID=64391 RepID=A0A653CLM4_CALMS|nr:unnamed protein product [Callosobruchus maculatus]
MECEASLKNSAAILILLTIFSHVNSWYFKCENGFCIRNADPNDKSNYPTLELCSLVCSSFHNVWPQPTGKMASLKNIVRINPNKIEIKLNGPPGTDHFIADNILHFSKKLKKEEPYNCTEKVYPLKIILTPKSNNPHLDLNTNESYTLEIIYEDDTITASINAYSIFGIRHGLETLFQLIIPYEDGNQKCIATLSYVYISDKPVYKHRGLLLDTGRNFLSVDTIKRHLDGMAASKLNVLHWHITDSQSFPLEVGRLPNMTKYGAYSEKHIYSESAIKDLLQYANRRGVRILPEIDAPSHAGNGWQWGEEAGLGNLAVCINRQPWRSFCIQPPCGQLNPTNQNLYSVLKDLYSHMRDHFPDTGMFHMGGDEVFIPCWNSTQEIIDYLRGKPLTTETFLDLWGEFQRKALAAYDRAFEHEDTSIVVWTSHITQPEVIRKYLSNERYIIQTWVPESNINLITELLKLEYRVIISTKDKWYLDHGFWGSTLYYNWKTVYENKMYKYNHEGILGGEVCMWGELVDDNNIDSRVWPRAAAAAERLWSNPRSTAEFAQYRFFAQRKRLVDLGIHAEALTPKWCVDSQGECKTYL